MKTNEHNTKGRIFRTTGKAYKDYMGFGKIEEAGKEKDVGLIILLD